MLEFKNMLNEIIELTKQSRSYYIDAIHMSKQANWTLANKHFEEGHKLFNSANRLKNKVYENVADYSEETLLLIQVETQIMGTETIGIMAEEFMDLLKL